MKTVKLTEDEIKWLEHLVDTEILGSEDEDDKDFLEDLWKTLNSARIDAILSEPTNNIIEEPIEEDGSNSTT